MSRRRAARVVGTLALLAMAAACDDRGSFRGIALEPPEPAPALRLARAAGDTFDLAAQRGQAVLVFFGYTHCPDICPTTLSDWARVRRALGDDADRVRFVFVSVDPGRDTPADAQQYAAQFDSSFVGLAADPATLPALLAGFRVAAFEEPPADPAAPEAYGVSHGSQVFLIDPEGRLRALYPVGSTVDDVLADVRRVVD